MTAMDILQQMALTLLFAFLFLWDKSSAVTFSRNPEVCKHALENVCYEFVEGSFDWEEARLSCEKEGGNLLKEMSDLLRFFLQNTMKDTATTDLSWWLGQGFREDQKLLNKGKSDIKGDCKYLKLNPLQIVSSTDCTERRGFFCTHRFHHGSDKETSFTLSHSSHSLVKRSIATDLDGIESSLRNYEQDVGQPSAANQITVIGQLLAVAKALASPFEDSSVSRVINCTTAMLTLSLERCNVEEEPNPTDLFEKIFEVYKEVSLKVGSELPDLVLPHPDGTMYQKSFDVADISKATLGSKQTGEFAVLPSGEALSKFLPAGAKVIGQLTTFKSNPHPTNEVINGQICSLSLNDGSSDKEIAVNNLPDSDLFEIFLPRSNAKEENISVSLEENKIAMTEFNVTDTNVTVFLSIEPSQNISLRLLLNYDSPPNGTFNGSQIILNPEEGYRWMMTPEMFGGLAGRWYVDCRLHNSQWSPDLKLSISSYTTKCVYWDKGGQLWTTYGCKVGPKSNPWLTQCLCNHLTLFGSSFFVMPNYVDLSRTAELFATVSKNFVVLALLCTFFGLYLMTLMWACYADRKASSKRKITLLDDNHPGAQYNYLICVHTGNRKNAGTTASVTMKLIGSEGESDIYNLIDPDKPVFERGSVDVFLLATPYPLGEVKNMRLQHDNSGGRPSWYINKVTIQDFQTKNVFVFFCNCWLSSDKGDGMTKKTFNAAKTNEIASFRNIFTTRTSNGFRDEHIWVSVWDPPSRSPFTRAQRISCCMSLLLCTMAINIAFWNIPVDSSSPVILSLGIIRLTWQEIMVGIQSGLLMFPINILIITIFRSIKPRIVPKKDEDEEIVKPAPVSIPSILKETQQVIVMMSQSPRNKICQTNPLETSADLCPALENVHEFIQLMQGETMSDSHWVYCSKFLLCALCHLLQCLEKIDPKNFPATYEYQHLLSTTNLLVRKAEMVFTSHMAYCPPPVKVVKKKRTPSFWLPWWCVFIGWFLLLSISGISTFFTLLYGFEYGREKSIKWVMSLGLSLFESIFILQPLKVIGIAVVFALLLKPVSVEETEEIEQVLLAQQDKCRRYTGRDV